MTERARAYNDALHPHSAGGGYLTMMMDDGGRSGYAPRVALIGDSAHATGPVWAQGAAMAMEDAIVLADLMARTDDWSIVGSIWEQVRRPRVEHVQAATDQMSRLATLPPWLSHAGTRHGSTCLSLRLPPAPKTTSRPARMNLGDARRADSVVS